MIENEDNSVTTKLACRRLTINLRKRNLRAAQNFRLNSTVPLLVGRTRIDSRETSNLALINFYFYVQFRIRNIDYIYIFLWTHKGETVHLYSLHRWLNHISVITSALRKRRNAVGARWNKPYVTVSYPKCDSRIQNARYVKETEVLPQIFEI